MKQIYTNCTLNLGPTPKYLTAVDKVLSLDQILLIVNVTRGATYYNFASGPRISRQTIPAPSLGTASTRIYFATSIDFSEHENTDSVVIFYDDKETSVSVSGSVTANVPIDVPPYVRLKVKGQFHFNDTDLFLKRTSPAQQLQLNGALYYEEYSDIYLGYHEVDGDSWPAIYGGPENKWLAYNNGVTSLFEAIRQNTWQYADSYFGVGQVPAGKISVSFESPSAQQVSVTNMSSQADAGGNPVIRTFAFGYDYENEMPVAIGANTDNLSLRVWSPFMESVGLAEDAVATSDTGTFGLISLIKKLCQGVTNVLGKLPSLTSSSRIPVDGSGVTQPVSATSLPLPSGAATSANQTTANTSLSSIDSKILNVTGYGTTGTPIQAIPVQIYQNGPGAAWTGIGSVSAQAVPNTTGRVQSTTRNSSVFIAQSSGTILSSNLNRLGFTMTNYDVNDVYIRFAAAAANTTTDWNIKLKSGERYEQLGPLVYSGEIRGIYAAGGTTPNANLGLRVTEWV